MRILISLIALLCIGCKPLNDQKIENEIDIGQLVEYIERPIQDLIASRSFTTTSEQYFTSNGNELTATRLLLQDQNLLAIHKDGVISFIVIDNPSIPLDSKIRVGDSLGSIFDQDSKAVFFSSLDIHELIVVSTRNGRIKYTFDTSLLPLENMIQNKQYLKLENPDIQGLKISEIAVFGRHEK